MSSVLKWMLLALAAVWCTGWLGCTLYMFFLGPGSEDKKQDGQNRFFGALFISAFLWPALWPSARRHRRFERGLQTGKRPQWLVRAEGERPDVERTLADGTEFYASPRRRLLQAHPDPGRL
jgi:hypothetical protein